MVVETYGVLRAGADGKLRDSQLPTKVTGARIHSTLLGQAMRKLRKGEAVKIVARGDSTTYGHDTVSADRVPAPTGTLPDGSKHSNTRSPRPWPKALGEHLSEVYSGMVTVDNQGFSGDYVQRGFNRWLNNVEADITLISYGVNDAQAEYVPEQIRGNVDEFVRQHERMILRDLEWGSAVILLTPMKQRGASGNIDIDTFRNALQGLAVSYGIPIIDMETFLAGASRNCWADGNHLTTKGNGIVGARLASVFIGEGPYSPLHVSSGSKLLPRRTLNNFVLGKVGVAFANSTSARTPLEDADNAGPELRITSSAVPQDVTMGTFSFYVDEPDVLISPIDYLFFGPGGSGAVKIAYDLDFGVEQGDNYHDQIIKTDLTGSDQSLFGSPSTITRSIITPNTGRLQHDPRLIPASSLLRVTQTGWHSLRVRAITEGTTTNSDIALQAIEFVPWRAHQEVIDTAIVKTRVGTYKQDVHPWYDESQDITQTLIPWYTLLRSMGITPWENLYYKAPILRLSVRSYTVGWMEYDLLITRGNPSSVTPIPAVPVGGPIDATETNGIIHMVREAGAYSTRFDGLTPKTAIAGRELQSVALDGSNNLVLTWRTTNSSGGVDVKNNKRNFTLSIRPL